jgi:hypothetical protein
MRPWAIGAAITVALLLPVPFCSDPPLQQAPSAPPSQRASSAMTPDQQCLSELSWAASDADSTTWDPSGPTSANLQGLLAVALPCNLSGVEAAPGGGLAVYLTPLDDHTRSVADVILNRYLPQVTGFLDSYTLKEGKQSLAQAEVQMAKIGKRHQRCIGYGARPDGSVQIDHGCFTPVRG